MDPKALIKTANSRLAGNQKIDSFSLWPGDDFPRTHTLKLKREDIIKKTVLQKGP